MLKTGYDTLSEAINNLREEGYIEDFNLQENSLECRSGTYRLRPEDFHVDKFYRFEGMSDPDDSDIVYAISSDNYKLKGILVNGYGIYSEPLVDEMLSKLRVH
jgi:hypothetical protein